VVTPGRRRQSAANIQVTSGLEKGKNMASVTQPNSPTPAPPVAAAPGLSIKLLMGAAGAGIVIAFLPAASFSLSMLGQSISQSILVCRVWQGSLGLLCYIAGGVLAFFLARAETPQPKLTWAAVGVGGLTVLLALGLLISTFGAGASAGAAAFGMQAETHVGSGTILNLLAAGALATGAFLKAKEDRLF
jgi:hypothetical protein